jgi:hypothetical protein
VSLLHCHHPRRRGLCKSLWAEPFEDFGLSFMAVGW